MKFFDKFKKKPVVLPAKKEEAITTEKETQEYPPVNEDEFIKRAESAVLSVYPDIQNLIVSCRNTVSWGCGETRYLHVSWINGINECFIVDILKPLIDEYPIGKNPLFDYVEYYVISPRRRFTDDVILEAARKYADCISKDLPINMHNVHCFKVGNVSIYDLAIGELQLKDVV